MSSHKLQASAPGTLFLIGEHAVLQGYGAITCAVDKRIHISLHARSDDQVIIQSSLGNYQSRVSVLQPEPKLSFVLASIARFQPQLNQGFELQIESEFSHQVGLGSSAAVTVACCALFSHWLMDEVDQRQVFEVALAVMREVQQGRGSGADLAASVYGGLVAYQMDPCVIRPLAGVPEISLFFSGYKLKTPEVIARVEALASASPQLYQQLYALMGAVTDAAVDAIEGQDWHRYGQLMNQYQGLMDALGVNDRTLSDMVYRLRQEGALGSKITGSGLGDCVYALGPIRDQAAIAYESIPVQVCSEGVRVSRI